MKVNFGETTKLCTKKKIFIKNEIYIDNRVYIDHGGVVHSRGASNGVLVFLDNRVLQLLDVEVGIFSVSCRFKNCDDDFCWNFTGVYGPTMKKEREGF